MANDKPQFYRYKRNSPISPSPQKPDFSLTRLNQMLHQFADWLNDWHLVRIFSALSSFLLFAVLFSLWVELQDRQIGPINSAWQLLTSDVPGQSGKIQAIEYLNGEKCLLTKKLCWKKKVPLTELNLAPKNNTAPGVFLLDANLVEADLTGAVLTRADLRKANLAEADLNRADLTGAHLFEANLREADLREAYLIGTDFRGANLIEADLTEADLTEADLTWANFTRANLFNAYFRGADLHKANLIDAYLIGAIFFEADLTGTDLTGADLREADLRGTDLREADLRRADLRAAVFSIKSNPVPSIVCNHLKQARNWELAYRDELYACGETIPVHPDDRK